MFIKMSVLIYTIIITLKKYQFIEEYQYRQKFYNFLLIKDITEKKSIRNVYFIDRFIEIVYAINVKISIII